MRDARFRGGANASVIGKLGPVRFSCGSYYVSAEGNLPQSVDREIRQNPVLKDDIITIGIHGDETFYHITSELGVKIFADIIKRRGLHKSGRRRNTH